MDDSLISFLDCTGKEQLSLLQKLVLQPSHSLNKEGVDRVGQIITDALSDCDLSLTVNKQETYGDNLIFSSRACNQGNPHILLAGHMDTVFPLESGFNIYRQDGNRIIGPGIIDMKGGLVTAIFLLKALQSQNMLKDIPIIFVCNSDEEVGSPQSTDIIKNSAADCLCGLVFECGGLGGEIVTGRKGKAGYHLEVFGQAGHAAFSGKNGKASAVVELAHKILAIESLNDPKREIVVNVGLIQGGTGANVIPGRATAVIDTRYITGEDGDYLHNKINEITAHSSIAETRAVLSSTNSRFPMVQSPKNMSLFSIFEKQAKQLGITIQPELRSGVSDANTIAECGVPVLDGLGPVGDLDHSENEYMLKDSLLERCKLATLAVLDIWRGRQQ